MERPWRLAPVNKKINQDLVQAYTAAKYIVHGEQEELIEVRVGQPCSVINKLILKADSKLAVLLTPENPFSESLSEAQNAARHTEFLAAIHSEHVNYLTGYGCDDEELWGREASYLLFLQEKKFADKLALQFGQNAYLLLVPKNPARLMLRSENSFIDSAQ
jgi:hypothetical protein